MSVFWSIAGLMVIGALFFLVPPLVWRKRTPESADARATSIVVYREHLAEYDAERQRGQLSVGQYGENVRELERRVLEDTRRAEEGTPPPASRASIIAAIALVVTLPPAALGVYRMVGNPDALQPRSIAQAPHHAVSPEQILSMVERLAERMAKSPDDAQGWAMVARSYNALGRYGHAVNAYGRVVELGGADAQLLADYADTLAMVSGRSLAGRPLDLVEKALTLDPNNQKALALAGTAAFDRQDFEQAIAFWQRLERTFSADAPDLPSVQRSLAEARAALGSLGDARSAKVNASKTTGGDAHVSGMVELSAALASRVSPSDTLFVFARAAEGPRMPLAIFRGSVDGWPRAFHLDDTLAMSPQMKLSKFSHVVIEARLSKRGVASPQSGDLRGTTPPVKVGSDNLKLTIDQVVP